MSETFIKLFRKIEHWRWYTDAVVSRLFIHLLIKATYDHCGREDQDLKPGELITGRRKLASELALTEKQIRGALLKLERTGEISIKRASKYSVITINEWGTYQISLVRAGPAKGPSRGRQRATIQEGKEIKEELFNRFWLLYDKKEGKKQCGKKWKSLSPEVQQQILEHVPKYVASTPDKRFRKNPLTYLNGEHWEDEIIDSSPANRKRPEERKIQKLER
ncbi:hypothetical protein [Maribellus sp. YY47]|uniref:hypothetical protein n=1 Tax=Maribellus sp. YY47 TaxID=2929486 RepID=UPI00200147D6|nr:hypothetical protein [Maribellus sp. YY47]MCK3684378.1 hypothetical protein [Maribellus sp. YY47]